MAVYEEEIYEEMNFKKKYEDYYKLIRKKAHEIGVDLGKYYFAQLLRFNNLYEITYVLEDNENVSITFAIRNDEIIDVTLSED